MKKGILKNKSRGLVIYGVILLLITFILVFMIMTGTIVGERGYFIHVVLSIFALVLGVPLFIFAFSLLIGEVVAKVKQIINKNKAFKEDLFVTGALFIGALITFGFVFVGIKEGKDVINDYAYTKDPEVIVLYNCSLEYRSGRHNLIILAGTYKLHGEDKYGNSKEFLIGESTAVDISDFNATLKIEYLPNLNIIWSIENYLE